MSVSDENLGLYLEMQKKSQALYDYINALIDNKTVANESFLNIKKEKAEFELARVEGLLAQLDAERPIHFPSQQQFDDMRESVAALQQAILGSAAVTALVAAGDAMIAAWPTS